MKKLVLSLIAIVFLVNTQVLSAEKKKGFFGKIFHSDHPEGVLDKLFEKDSSERVTSSVYKNNETLKQGTKNKKKSKFFNKIFHKNHPEGVLDKLFKKDSSESVTSSVYGNDENLKQETKNKKLSKSSFSSDHSDVGQNISFYTGTFDIIDKEGDDKTSLIGLEHKNKNLFRETWLGRISPTSGAFVTGKNSIYLYTGIETDYNLGPINISPSFAPGYYEAGNGKNLGSALEFKSEVKVGIDLFKNSNLGYSYSHISNNDWGDVNPGTDNQSITFSKKY